MLRSEYFNLDIQNKASQLQFLFYNEDTRKNIKKLQEGGEKSKYTD